MVSHEEMYRRVLKNRDEYIERENRRKKIMIRSAVVFSGLCAAVIFGIKLQSDPSLKTPDNNSLIIEETSFPEKDDIAETEKPVCESTVLANEEQIRSTDSSSVTSQVSVLQTTESVVNDKKTGSDSQKSDIAKENTTTTYITEVTKEKPVSFEKDPEETIQDIIVTDTDPATEEETKMKIQYKKAIAFLTALAAANPGGMISYAADAVNEFTDDETALIYIDENIEKFDFNADGIFNMFDTYDLYLYLKERESLPDEHAERIENAADVNTDGIIDELDYNLIDGYGNYNLFDIYHNYDKMEEYRNDFYGSEEIKTDFINLSFLDIGNKDFNISMKYSAPTYLKLCREIESGNIDPDVNEDGVADLKDLYDFFIYKQYTRPFDLQDYLSVMEKDYEMTDGMWTGIEVPKKIDIPDDIQKRIISNCRPFFKDDTEYYTIDRGTIGLLARYYITHSDIKNEYLEEEFYDNIYKLDLVQENGYTDSETFMICLSEWLMSSDVSNYNKYKNIKVDDMEYMLYEDHAVLSRSDSDAKTVEIPSEICGQPVTKIGEQAFSRNKNLKTVFIPASVTVIDKQAFEDCEELENVNFSEGLQEIFFAAFCGCRSIKNIELPSTLTKIWLNAFENCSSLTEIVIPDGIDGIASYTFSGCSSLKKTVLPDSVTYINLSAFADCTNLEDINFTDSLETIDNCAFKNCGFKTLSFPSGLKRIEQYAFSENKNLENVEFSEGLEHIGIDAFFDCPKLKSATIPKSVDYIWEPGFGECIIDNYRQKFDFVLKCYPETEVGTPEEFGLPYIVIDEEDASAPVKEEFKPKAAVIQCGDLDGNGSADLTDLSTLSVALLSKKEMNEKQRIAADIDANGVVDIADLAYLKQYVSKDASVKAMFEMKR